MVDAHSARYQFFGGVAEEPTATTKPMCKNAYGVLWRPKIFGSLKIKEFHLVGAQ
jgi:hypothetical protein